MRTKGYYRSLLQRNIKVTKKGKSINSEMLDKMTRKDCSDKVEFMMEFMKKLTNILRGFRINMKCFPFFINSSGRPSTCCFDIC